MLRAEERCSRREWKEEILPEQSGTPNFVFSRLLYLERASG